jgi:hypothetical protein
MVTGSADPPGCHTVLVFQGTEKGGHTRIRELGLRVQELEAGPFTFLLVDSQPVAYADRSLEVPRYYRVREHIRKGVTKALNKWLRGKAVEVVPQASIVGAFQGISRFGPEPVSERRQNERRSGAEVDPRVAQLAKALVDIMGNGASR